LLALLAVQSWTGYELTQQARRSLRFVWPTSDAHLYREQKRLVRLGWATVEREQVGQRSRNRYSITAAGRKALRQWLGTDPVPPRIEVEGIVRAFFADHGGVDDLAGSLRRTSEQAREMIDDMCSYAADYLETGGPFPDRIHVIALASDLVTDILGRIKTYCDHAATEVEGWETTENLGLTEATRARLEDMLARHS
jgi:DNA-binding PadR family transcriptional regulator